MRRVTGLAFVGWCLACGSGPQSDGDTANDVPPNNLTFGDVVSDGCGLGTPAIDGPYTRTPRDDGGFVLTWDPIIGGSAPGMTAFAFVCERDAGAGTFACWPSTISLFPDGTRLPANTAVWLRGEEQGDTLVGQAAFRVSCDGLDPTCVVDDTGLAIAAPCETIVAFEITVAESVRPGRCPDVEMVAVTEPATVYFYNYTGTTLYGRYATPDGLAPFATLSTVGPSVFTAYQGGFFAFTGNDDECLKATPIDAERVYVELRSKP